jgi:hypothetical protein
MLSNQETTFSYKIVHRCGDSVEGVTANVVVLEYIPAGCIIVEKRNLMLRKNDKMLDQRDVKQNLLLQQHLEGAVCQ